jgi:glycosyltransferase involved in cell wall biosynthesis
MGGIEVHLRDLVKDQTKTHSVTVIVANERMRTIREHQDGARLIRLSCVGSIGSMPVCPALPWNLHQTKADLIHLHMPNPAAAFAYIVSRSKTPLVMTHHSDTMGRAGIRRLSDPFVRQAMQRAARIIVTTKRYADTSDELRKYENKIEVVPLGIDPKRFAAADLSIVRKIREQFGPKLIIAIGRLVPFKGFETMIRAMQRVRGHLLLVGDGPLRKRLEVTAAECGIAGRVHFAGKIDNGQIPNFLSASDVFVLPAINRAESFGIVQLEAMAAGLPVVNTSINSGVPEVSIDGQTGLTVPPGDLEGLGHAIQMLLDRKDLREKFGAAAKARVNAEFTVDLMCARTMRIYEEVLQHP